MVTIEMEDTQKGAVKKFPLLKQSSMAPEKANEEDLGADQETVTGIDHGVRLMYLVNEGDLDGITEALDSGTDVNFKDIDGRTALHIAACQGFKDVVLYLLDKGAEVDTKDRWGSTPLADAIYYKNQEVMKILEKCGASPTPVMTPMRVNHPREVPEYEINPKEIDFTDSFEITKGTYRVAMWRGTQVAVKQLGEQLLSDEEKVQAFRDELGLLQKVRHPNVVQFLGAVTQSSPMMIVTEYLPKGDLYAFLKKKGALKPSLAVKLALDIARGMNYLHENKPPIIHCDLEPSNILRDDSGHLKVADFDGSKYLSGKTGRSLSYEAISCRYVAPEVFRNEEYDTKVDVFSFGLILQEMIEGKPPFLDKNAVDVPTSYASHERPQFNASMKSYSHGIRELILECWDTNPDKRPSFTHIITRLEAISYTLEHKKRWKIKLVKYVKKAMMKKDKSENSRSLANSTR